MGLGGLFHGFHQPARYPHPMETIPGHLERLPPGGDRLQAEMLSRSQRDRILLSMATLVAKRGYQGTTVERIVKRARVSRGTFYANFENREACLLAVFDEAAVRAERQIIDAASEAGDWPLEIRAGIAAFLDYVVANPALARTCLVESVTAGPVGIARYEDAMRKVAPLLARGRQLRGATVTLPETLEDSIVGGIVWMVHQRLLHGEVDKIPGLLPAMLNFVLTPYLGDKQSAEFLAEV